MKTKSIKEHNTKAAATWDTGGKGYDNISLSISDGIEHAIARLDPKTGEKVLDVATGTGWAARSIAKRGAEVEGVDFGKDLIEAAKKYSEKEGNGITFRTGDAEDLAYEDQSFDAVISTFGVMFVSNPEAAAKELARVTKKGGRVALTTWTPDSTIAGMFKVMKPYMNIPATPPPSPFAWGDRNRIKELLGEYFDLKFETGVTYFRQPNGEAAWNLFVENYGPTKVLNASLDDDKKKNLKKDFVSFHESFRSELGVSMPREYLVTVGVRK